MDAPDDRELGKCSEVIQYLLKFLSELELVFVPNDRIIAQGMHMPGELRHDYFDPLSSGLWKSFIWERVMRSEPCRTEGALAVSHQ